MFTVLVGLAWLACAAALFSQAPRFDPLDVWALPALAVTLLVQQVLLTRNILKIPAAFSGGFMATAAYVLLALNHQFSVMPRTSTTLMENTYWFAVLYGGAFLTYPNRRATQVSTLILVLAALICLWHLHFTVPPATHGKVQGSVIQFLLVGAVLITMQSTFGQQRTLLLASRAAAYTDALTGLANRRAAEERLRSLSGLQPGFTLVLFDLDHFKQINDQHGHAVGDLVLRRVADLTRQHLPPGGLAARWGGEEFLLILPAMDDQQARRMLYALRDDLRQQQHGPATGVTASFGVALARPGEHPDEVLQRADSAMYAAKGQGRNDIRLADWESRPAASAPQVQQPQQA